MNISSAITIEHAPFAALKLSYYPPPTPGKVEGIIGSILYSLATNFGNVLDPAETDFAFDKPANFIDMESGRDLYIDPAAARETYRRNFSLHDEQLRRTCRELGIDVYTLLTSQPLELSLFDFLQARLHAGRSGRLSASRTGNRGAAS